MVKSDIQRAEKFEKKISGDVRKQRYDSQKKQMDRLEANASEDLMRIELQIKNMVQGEPALYLPYYIIFAKVIYRLQNKFKGQNLINELEVLQGKWERRGLNINLLNEIKHFYVPSYIPFVCITAKFDVGKFDVNCFG